MVGAAAYGRAITAVARSALLLLPKTTNGSFDAEVGVVDAAADLVLEEVVHHTTALDVCAARDAAAAAAEDARGDRRTMTDAVAVDRVLLSHHLVLDEDDAYRSVAVEGR